MRIISRHKKSACAQDQGKNINRTSRFATSKCFSLCVLPEKCVSRDSGGPLCSCSIVGVATVFRRRFFLEVEADGFQTHRKRGHTAGNIRKEEMLANAVGFREQEVVALSRLLGDQCTDKVQVQEVQSRCLWAVGKTFADVANTKWSQLVCVIGIQCRRRLFTGMQDTEVRELRDKIPIWKMELKRRSHRQVNVRHQPPVGSQRKNARCRWEEDAVTPEQLELCRHTELGGDRTEATQSLARSSEVAGNAPRVAEPGGQVGAVSEEPRTAGKKEWTVSDLKLRRGSQKREENGAIIQRMCSIKWSLKVTPGRVRWERQPCVTGSRRMVF